MRIAIHGPSGAGKSTLAHILCETLAIPQFELDRDVRSKESNEIDTERLNGILARSSWIVEGSEPLVFTPCINAADLIFILTSTD